MYGVYELTGKGGYRILKLTLPTGIIEASIAGLRQGYLDSWQESLSPGQRITRMVIVAFEAGITDSASAWAGAFGAAVGAAAGPVPAAVGYGASAILVSYASEQFWTNTFNPSFIPSIGMGVWP